VDENPAPCLAVAERIMGGTTQRSVEQFGEGRGARRTMNWKGGRGKKC
jgi:hypothetical protein